jgi:DNA-binding XRE family transcriptional regulator
MRALQSENDSLRQEKAGLEQERDALKAQLVAAIKDKKARETVAAYQATLDSANGMLHQVATERDNALRSLTALRNILGACQSKNAKLVDVSRDIVKAYENIDFFDALLAADPVIQAKKVEVENLAQDASDRIDAATFATPPAAPSSADTQQSSPAPANQGQR